MLDEFAVEKLKQIKAGFAALQAENAELRAELDKQRTVNATLFENSVALVVHQRTAAELAEARAYADKLAAGLPEGMLPKDVENLRAANAQMAARIVELELDDTLNRKLIESITNQFDKAHVRIAELEAARRWIPVGERLPEGDNVVLTLNQHSGFVTKGYYVAGRGVYGYWWQYYPERGEMHPSYMPKSDPVTHWMPLPAAPEVNHE